MEAMSVEAVGIYLDRLADLQGLKVKAVATQAGVKPGYISRLISRDIKEPSASVLKALTDAVGGSWEDVGALLDARADRAQAEALADAWYARIRQSSGVERDVLRRRLLSAIRPLLENPDQLARFLHQQERDPKADEGPL
jgi:transcriptional regulator with XRE-family HTH domain